jgi:hypothetical protein
MDADGNFVANETTEPRPGFEPSLPLSLEDKIASAEREALLRLTPPGERPILVCPELIDVELDLNFVPSRTGELRFNSTPTN